MGWRVAVSPDDSGAAGRGKQIEQPRPAAQQQREAEDDESQQNRDAQVQQMRCVVVTFWCRGVRRDDVAGASMRRRALRGRVARGVVRGNRVNVRSGCCACERHEGGAVHGEQSDDDREQHDPQTAVA